MAFKARIAFKVDHINYATSDEDVMGNKISWSDVVYVYSTKVAGFVNMHIERALHISGAYVEIASIPWDHLTYTDPDGTESSWYRVRLEDALGHLSEYTLPKTVSKPLTTVIHGFVRRLDGEPSTNTDLYFRLFRPPKLSGEKDFIEAIPYVASTARDGYFQVELLKGVAVTVTSREVGLDKTEFIVPSDVDFVELSELLL